MAPPTASSTPPPRPPRWEEILAQKLFTALSPRLVKVRTPAVPQPLRPAERLTIDRGGERDHLAVTWFPARGASGGARGAVLFAHPWVPWGEAYLHRRGRIEAVRRAGYHALTFDFGGFGRSGRRPRGFYDADVADVLAALRQLAPGLPLHLWGVSFGGYWAHPLLSRDDAFTAAVFEDVAHHLIEWSKRSAPYGLPAYLVFQHLFRRAYRYLDLRRHAPHLKLRAAAYVGGERDPGARPDETRELARLAGADSLVVPEAGHLQAIKAARGEIVDLALATFARGEEAVEIGSGERVYQPISA
jgi:hypothetical protein